MDKKILYYAVNVDFDASIDDGMTLKEALNWFYTEEAEESYTEDWPYAVITANRVYEERMKKQHLAELEEAEAWLYEEFNSGKMTKEQYDFELEGILLSKDLVSKS